MESNRYIVPSLRATGLPTPKSTPQTKGKHTKKEVTDTATSESYNSAMEKKNKQEMKIYAQNQEYINHTLQQQKTLSSLANGKQEQHKIYKSQIQMSMNQGEEFYVPKKEAYLPPSHYDHETKTDEHLILNEHRQNYRNRSISSPDRIDASHSSVPAYSKSFQQAAPYTSRPHTGDFAPTRHDAHNYHDRILSGTARYDKSQIIPDIYHHSGAQSFMQPSYSLQSRLTPSSESESENPSRKDYVNLDDITNLSKFNKKRQLFKTELCRSWEETGRCRYGENCHFAHSMEEKRGIQRHPRYKTEICKTYWEQGSCPYGKRCCFIHTESTVLGNDQAIEDQTLYGSEARLDSVYLPSHAAVAPASDVRPSKSDTGAPFMLNLGVKHPLELSGARDPADSVLEHKSTFDLADSVTFDVGAMHNRTAGTTGNNDIMYRMMDLNLVDRGERRFSTASHMSNHSDLQFRPQRAPYSR